jgi:hypothetical protein
MSDSKLRHVHMGLGSAIRRFMDIEFQMRLGGSGRDEETKLEREMLLQALDAVPLDLGFDCNVDGVPDTVEIFRQSAATSCCRIVPGGGGPPETVVTATIREGLEPILNKPKKSPLRGGGSRRIPTRKTED